MHFIYIIHTKLKNHYYVGETHDLEQRLLKHNNYSYKGSFSKIASDWKIVLTYNCNFKEDALFLERFIKRMKSKVFIEKNIRNPSILNTILRKKK